MEEGKNIPVEKKKSGNKNLLIILLVVLLAASAFLLWQWMGMRSEYEEFRIEKEAQRNQLTIELDSLVLEHNHIKTEYGTLADSLAIKDSVIQANAKEIKKLLATKWEYYKVKKKLDRLRNITQGYLHQMDSLYRENADLKVENTEMKQEIKRVSQKSRKLEQQQKEIEEKIEDAARITAFDIICTTSRLKGSNREVATDKARRVERIKVCFTLQPNPLVSKGNKEVYIRLTDPEGNVYFKDKGDAYSFEYEGQKLQYSLKEGFNYTGEPYELCLNWNKLISDDKFEAGRYSIDIYVDSQKAGSTVFFMR